LPRAIVVSASIASPVLPWPNRARPRQLTFNHPQFTQIPEKIVVGSLPVRFLNRDFTDSGIRGMWVQLKLVF
jgi:hypothetical protein